MKVKGVLLNVPLLWVEGMAFFPFILSKKKSPGIIFMNHERIHLKQQLEMGLLLFYLWYFVEYFVRFIQFGDRVAAYFNISFEREAYRNEMDLNYLSSRKFWAFLKYL
jgi:hypothetical protein